MRTAEEDANWSDWIVRSNTPDPSLVSEESSDLEALVPYLEGKRLVQLGESGHGISRFSSPTSENRRPEFFRRVVGRFNAEYADQIYESDVELTSNFNHKSYIASMRSALIDEYDSLADSVAAHNEKAARGTTAGLTTSPPPSQAASSRFSTEPEGSTVL